MQVKIYFRTTVEQYTDDNTVRVVSSTAVVTTPLDSKEGAEVFLESVKERGFATLNLPDGITVLIPFHSIITMYIEPATANTGETIRL